jgi:hypothetical protein
VRAQRRSRADVLGCRNSPNFADSTLIEVVPKARLPSNLLISFIDGADVSAETSVVKTYCLVKGNPAKFG